ncbi:MFS transporter [Propionibacterium sp.]|uniref:MFS transporter n=1 Tax=Propionibacterium sp. TaxID=1977903 RepID=UPI00345EA77D
MKRIPVLSFAVMFLVATDTFLVAPLLPDLTRRFGNSPRIAGWMVSAYAIGYCLTAVFSGPISDRFNRRNVLFAGTIAFCVATFACGLAWSFPAMLALRFATGVAAAVGSPQIWAAIPQLVAPSKVVATMAAPTAGLTIAQLAGVPVGSFLAAVSTSTPFFVVGAVAALVAIAMGIWFPSVPPTGHSGGIIAQYAGLLRTPHAPTRFAAYLVFQLGNFAVLSFAATWFARGFGLSVSGIGVAMIVLGAGNTLGAVVGPRIVRRVGQGRTLAVAMACYLVGYLALPFSAGIVAAAAILSGTFFLGGTIFPVFMGLLQSLTTTARGTVSALANMFMYLGSTIAGIIGGPLLAALPGFWGISLLAMVAMAASLGLWAASGSLRRMPASAARGSRTEPATG